MLCVSSKVLSTIKQEPHREDFSTAVLVQGWGLFALGIISLLPGIHGTSMLYRVWAGQEKWEDLSW